MAAKQLYSTHVIYCKERIKAFEMKCIRKILGMSWIEKKTNEWVLETARVERNLLESIQGRKMSTGAWWFRGMFGALQLEGCGFEYTSKPPRRDPGQVLHSQLLMRFGVKLRFSVRAETGAPLNGKSVRGAVTSVQIQYNTIQYNTIQYNVLLWASNEET